MNTEQVVEMIDAITEGRHAKVGWEGAALTDDLQIDVRESSLRFTIRGEVFDVAHSRTAREIAGALVAWANRKEGKVDVSNKARSLVDTLVPTGAEFPSVNDWSDINSGRITREDWYRLHVVNMSPETIKTNMDALKLAAREWAPSSPKYHDTQKALNILHDSLMGIKPPNVAWREDWYRRNVGRMTKETKDRNLKDLRGIQQSNLSSTEDHDVAKAIDILLRNGAKDV